MFKKSIATFAMIAAITITSMASVSSAQAGPALGKRSSNANSAGAFAAGAFAGLAIGAIAAGANHDPHYRPRHDPRPRRYAPPPPPRPHYRPAPPMARYGKPAPWSHEWYRYCSSRYRSFDPHTGYFRGYDGRRHFCR